MPPGEFARRPLLEPRFEGFPQLSRGPAATWRAEESSVLLVVGLDDLGRDPAPVRNGVTVLAGPRPNGLVLLAVDGGGTGGTLTRDRAHRSALAATRATRVLDILGEGVPQLLGGIRREVDLV